MKQNPGEPKPPQKTNISKKSAFSGNDIIFSTLSMVPVAIALLSGKKQRIIFANPAFLSLTERTSKEVLDLALTDILQFTTKKQHEKAIDLLQKEGKAQQVLGQEVRISKDGVDEALYFNLNYQEISLAGEDASSVMITLEDVTGHLEIQKKCKDVETEFNSILEQPVMAIAIYRGKQMRLSFANEPMRAILGRGEEDFHKPFREVFPEIDDASFEKLLMSVYNTGIPHYGQEVPIVITRNRKEEEGFYSFVNQPLRNGANEIIGVVSVGTEVTQSVSTRKKAEESEGRFRHLIEASPIGVLFWNIEGSISNANESLLRMLGYTEDDLSSGLDWRSITPAEWLQADEEAQKQLLLTGRHSPYEKQYLHKNGNAIDVIIASSAFELSNNREGVTFVLDITARKQAEKAQLYRKVLLEAQNEAIPDAILIVDTNGTMLSYNKHFVELWNIPAEIIERNDDSAAMHFAMNQVVDPQAFIDKVQYCYDHPDEKVHEHILFKDGRIIERYGNSVVGEDDTRYGWIWFFRDITEQKHAEEKIKVSEQRFGAAVEAVEGVLWTNSAKGEMEGEQIGWSRLTGQTQEEYRGYGWTTAVHPDDVQPTIEAWNQAVKETTTFSFEHRLKLRNGEWGIFSIRAIPMLRPDGSVREWVGVHTDITARRNSEAALRESENRYQNFIRQSSEGIWRFELEVPIAIELPVDEQVELMFRYGFLGECNDAMAQMYGYSSAEELIGAPLKDFLPPDDDSRAYLSYLVTSAYRAQSIESKEIDRYGNTRYFSNTLVGVIESGKLVRAWGTQKDITSEKQAQEELRDSESRFQNLIHEASVGIILLIGEKMKVEIVNEAYGRLIDRSVDELLHKELFTVIPETEEYYRPILDQVRQTGEAINLYDSPYAVIKDGKLIEGYLNVVYQPYIHLGRPNGVMVLCQDVTQSVKAKKALEESEAKFRSVIAEAPAGIALFVGRDLVIENPNQAFIDIVGKGWGVVGLPLREAMPELITEGQPYLQILDDVYSSGEAFRTSGSMVKIVQNGVLTSRYYNFTYSPLFIDGKVWAILDIAFDVTDQIEATQKLKESENRFRTLAQALPQMVWMMDSSGNIEYGSREWEEYSGIADVVTAWGYMMHPEDKEDLMSEWATSFESKRSYRKELRLKNKFGQYRWFTSVGEPIPGADGNVLKWIGTLTDIHEQKTFSEKLEREVVLRTEELAQANKELYRSNEDLQQFAHVASHDLKEPVRKIMTFGNRLKYEYSENLPDKAQTYLAKIDSATRRMYDMIDGVLLYSSVMSTGLKSELVDLNIVLQNIQTDLEVPIAAGKAIIRYDNLPVVSGSRVLLYQLFYNLIGNSLKFAKDNVQPEINFYASGATQAQVKQAGLEDTQKFFCIQVTDNGIGLQDEYANKIFGTFTRLHSKDRYEGTGLGLSLCKKIAERHGGAIWAKGEEGVGATFYVLLPMNKAL